MKRAASSESLDESSNEQDSWELSEDSYLFDETINHTTVDTLRIASHKEFDRAPKEIDSYEQYKILIHALALFCEKSTANANIMKKMLQILFEPGTYSKTVIKGIELVQKSNMLQREKNDRIIFLAKLK